RVPVSRAPEPTAAPPMSAATASTPPRPPARPLLPRRHRSSPRAPMTPSVSTDVTLTGTLLDPILRSDPVGPRITYYDDATGERIELSAVTLGNWAAKTANLLRDELGAGPGSRVAVLLPAHWQTAAVLLGVWYIGAEVVLGSGEADVALCTADRID